MNSHRAEHRSGFHGSGYAGGQCGRMIASEWPGKQAARPASEAGKWANFEKHSALMLLRNSPF